MHKANVLLVAFSGYPEINSTWLHLDNGLALLAGALVAGGHRVLLQAVAGIYAAKSNRPNE